MTCWQRPPPGSPSGAGRRPGPARATEDVVTALREALADDLDTPTALGVLDWWAADESLDGALVADAADALLGINLK